MAQVEELTKTYTCIVCPRGCEITVRGAHDSSPDDLEVSGYSCKRGLEYAKAEHTHPMRTLTTTVVVRGAAVRRLAVQSSGGVPREKLRECLSVVNQAVVVAPVHMGDVIVPNVCGTGVDVIAARDVVARN